MTKLGVIDVEILHLGIKNGKIFNEKDIENSQLKRLGVGRILDSLASLKDRKLIDLNKDGSFSVTDLAREILWSEQIPIQVKILRLLEIKSCSLEIISDFLKISETKINEEIEKLRKSQFVLMSPLRQESKVIKMYEVLPEGIEKIKEVEKLGVQDNSFEKKSKDEIFDLIDEVINQIKESSDIHRKNIASKLEEIKAKLNSF
ncbi:conserved hypothetical protein [metagenome]